MSFIIQHVDDSSNLCFQSSILLTSSSQLLSLAVPGISESGASLVQLSQNKPAGSVREMEGSYLSEQDVGRDLVV